MITGLVHLDLTDPAARRFTIDHLDQAPTGAEVILHVGDSPGPTVQEAFQIARHQSRLTIKVSGEPLVVRRWIEFLREPDPLGVRG